METRGNLPVPVQYHGREPSYLKHLVLREYLARWSHKLGSVAQRGPVRLWYVDVFSGPWKKQDPELRDTSFCIALEELESAVATWARRGLVVEVSAIFVEKDPTAFAELQAFLKSRSGVVKWEAHNNEFAKVSAAIAQRLGSDPAFILVDPKGWKDAPMRHIAPLVREGSRDVLINVMFDHINRQKDRTVDFIREQMREFFGLDETDLPPGLSEDELFQLYREKLKEKCQLPFAADLVVPHPTADRAKFHLVVGGKNKAVIRVFRDVERRVMGADAAKVRDDAVQRKREATTGQLSLLSAPPPTDAIYEGLHLRDGWAARDAIPELLRARGPVTFAELWSELLQRLHLTVAELGEVVMALRSDGVLTVNLEKGKRAVREHHVITLVK